MAAAAEEIETKAFLASVFWLTPGFFTLSLITCTFPLSPFDIQKVSGDKFVKHFLNKEVGTGGGVVLGHTGTLLLQYHLCQASKEDWLCLSTNSGKSC